jgi:hypothetical protein
MADSILCAHFTLNTIISKTVNVTVILCHMIQLEILTSKNKACH